LTSEVLEILSHFIEQALPLWFLGNSSTMPNRNDPHNFSFDSVEETIWRDNHLTIR
jgi:hypothetical protein